jgi:hypothetical protein
MIKVKLYDTQSRKRPSVSRIKSDVKIKIRFYNKQNNYRMYFKNE